MKLSVSFINIFSAAELNSDRLDDFIDTINSKLQPMFMQIRKGTSEDNGQQYFALVRRPKLPWPNAHFDYTVFLSLDIMDCETTPALNTGVRLRTITKDASLSLHVLQRMAHVTPFRLKECNFLLSQHFYDQLLCFIGGNCLRTITVYLLNPGFKDN